MTNERKTEIRRLRRLESKLVSLTMAAAGFTLAINALDKENLAYMIAGAGIATAIGATSTAIKRSQLEYREAQQVKEEYEAKYNKYNKK